MGIRGAMRRAVFPVVQLDFPPVRARDASAITTSTCGTNSKITPPRAPVIVPILTSPSLCPPARHSPLAVGVPLRVHTWVSLHHDAGVPRYAQANAPQRLGAFAGPVGTTLSMCIDTSRSTPLPVPVLLSYPTTEPAKAPVTTPPQVVPTLPGMGRTRSPSTSPTPRAVQKEKDL